MALSCAKTFSYVSGGYGYLRRIKCKIEQGWSAVRKNDAHFPLAISTIERPRDHTSALTVYEVKASSTFDDEGEDPFIRSGCESQPKIGLITHNRMVNVEKMKTTAAGMTHSHITLAPNVGAGYTLFELPAHTEIAQLDFAFAVDKDVGRLYVAVHNTQLIFEEGEPFGHR